MSLNLEPMDIIVTRDRTPVSYGIRLLSHSRWSHVFVAGENGDAYTTYADLLHPLGQFRKVNAEKYLHGKTYAVFRVPGLTAAQVKAGIAFCESLIGQHYDYAGVLALAWGNLRGLGVRGVKDKLVYCAEEVGETYLQMGRPLDAYTHKQPNEMLPEDCIDPDAVIIQTNDEELSYLYGIHAA